MLTYSNYIELWTNANPFGFGQTTVAPPSYHEYVQREIYFKDYLDLFTNVATYKREEIDNRFYVQITGNQSLEILDISFVEPYCLFYEGNNFILVDYDYPWTENDLNEERRIQYIMIGEAAPNRNLTLVGYGKEDNANTFLYNILHTGTTSWLNKPAEVFDAVYKGKKRKKLLHLANSGYLNIDILPFSLNYSSNARESLLDVAKNLFQSYTLHLIKEFNDNNYIHEDNAQLAFSGPPTLHHYIADLIYKNSIILPNYINCRAELNNMIPGTLMSNGNFLIKWPENARLNGIFNNNGRLSDAPKLRCCCYYQQFQGGPHQLFIRNAFGLP